MSQPRPGRTQQTRRYRGTLLANEFTPHGRVYQLYRLMSQTTHGTVVGAGQFYSDSRDAWRNQGGEGEWVEAEFWAVPFVACWETATNTARRYRSLFAPDAPLRALADDADFSRTIAKVPPNSQARLAGAGRPGAARASAPMNRAQRRAAARKRGRGR